MYPEVPDAPVATPAAADAVPAPDATAAPVVENEPVETPEERKFTQKDLDEFLQKRVAKESRRLERVARAEAEAAYLRQQLERQNAPAPQKQDGAPQEKDFEGRPYHEFAAALARWEAKQEFEERFQSLEKQREQREAANRHEAAKQKLFEGAAEFPDFEEVAGAPDVLISNVMAQTITESEVSAKLAYYLGQNKAEAARIFNLPPTQQVRALAKIEDKLQGAPKPTGVPAPIKPNVGSAPSTKNPDDMPMDEWLKWRKAQLKKR